MAGISIIIPYFNRANTIERCLRSIGLDRGLDIEVIVVDDCSDLPYAGAGRSDVQVHRLERNMGPVAARAFGAARATKEFIMFFDSDDELLPDWHARFMAEVEAQPGFEVYGFPDEKYQGDAAFAVASLPEYWSWVQSDRRASDYLLVLRSSAYRTVPMPHARISELWYIVQLFERGLRARYAATPLFRYHQDSGNQLSKKRILHFDASPYTRASLAYASGVFGRHRKMMKQLARPYHDAWLRRLVKEGVLSFSVGSLARLFWGKNGRV
jgi:glycosyltransferase involved in cell wall biosynthesis